MIDIGANLADDAFAADLPQVLQRAVDAGVRTIVVTGSCDASNRRALELAEQHRGLLFATAGLHPHHATRFTSDTPARLRECLSHQAVLAVGETGLDFYRDLSPRGDQERVFEALLELAIETRLPMFLHERDAYTRLAEMLRSCRDRLAELVVHCFTGRREALHAYLDLDCHIGVTGWICDERRGAGLFELAADIPDDRLLIETDAPYLLPRTLRPKPASRRNEPAHLGAVVQALGLARRQPLEHIARITTANARRFFRMPDSTGSD